MIEYRSRTGWLLAGLVVVLAVSGAHAGIKPADPAEQARVWQKLQEDIFAVHENGRVAFPDIKTYPADLTVPEELRGFLFSIPFPTGTWVRCQQANNTMDHQSEHGASHGPDKVLRYSLDFNLGENQSGQIISAAAPGRAYVYDGARPLGPGQWDVNAAMDNGGLGNFVAIVHENGFASLFSHLDALDVRTGQSVAVGDAIGRMGRTGGAGGVAHLHFHVVPVLREPTPGAVKATDHARFSVEYNGTFGPSVPFIMQSERAVSAEAKLKSEDLDSRFFETDLYGVNPSSRRTERNYWYR